MAETTTPFENAVEEVQTDVFTDGNYFYKVLPEDHLRETEALRRVKGIQGCQQLVDFVDGVLITEIVPGQNLRETKVQSFTDKQLEDFLSTLVEMGKRGVTYEPRLQNIMYSPENGFVPIDYMSIGKHPVHEIRISTILQACAGLSENSIEPADERVGQLFNKILRTFYKVNPDIAVKAVTQGYDPREPIKALRKQLPTNSPARIEMERILSEQYQMPAEA